MTSPRLTIITPVLNQARFIEQTICSVLDQGYDNLEYIIIDGGSTDGSQDIIARYENDLTYWSSCKDASQCHAINRALDRATGDMVAILNSDDVYYPFALEAIASAFQCKQKPRWLVGNCLRISEHDQAVGSNDANAPKSLASFLMHNSGNLPQPATFIARCCIDKLGPLDTSLTMAFDYEYACRMLSQGHQPTLLKQTLAAQRVKLRPLSAQRTLGLGLEIMHAASRYAQHLTVSQRYELWANLDTRKRIYALAQAETKRQDARKFMLGELVHHPWWLSDLAVRKILTHGTQHPLPLQWLPRAA